MKTFISRLLLLAAGVLCLSCGTPAQGKTIDKEKVEALQKALKAATGESEPVTIDAKFDEALQLIIVATKEVPQNDRFDYDGKTFIFKDDGAGIESSHILYGENKVVLFIPKTGGTAKK